MRHTKGQTACTWCLLQRFVTKRFALFAAIVFMCAEIQTFVHVEYLSSKVVIIGNVKKQQRSMPTSNAASGVQSDSAELPFSFARVNILCSSVKIFVEQVAHGE